jgi:hypothetical protein
MPKAFLRFSPRNRSPFLSSRYSGSTRCESWTAAGALVVERQLLAAVPVGVVELRVAAVAVPAVVEVPHDLDAGLRIALAVDLRPGSKG